MRQVLVLSLILTVAACKRTTDDTGAADDTATDDTGDTTDTTDTADTADTSDTGPDTDTEVNNDWSGGDNGDVVPSRDADVEEFGNIYDGFVFSSLDWASTEGCWTTPDAEFNGPHKWIDYPQPTGKDVFVRLTPDGGRDMSLYLMQRTSGSTAKPPDAHTANTGDCWAMFGKTGPNPSQPESLCVYGQVSNAYSVLIGIAGAHDEDQGSYKIEIWEKDADSCLRPDG